MAAESSMSSRSKSSSHGVLLLCSHGERLVLRTSGTKENYRHRFWGCVYYGVHEGCNFFRWAESETELGNPKIARKKKKLASLKSRTKAAEWKLMVVALLGFVGWAGFLFLLLHNFSMSRPKCVIPLNMV
ncbi:hypothetical protein Ahy_Scaffold1g107134 [Arachis hypogaea]|uniref:GRF-type domain-containing protein n=1 Tax=Arachis hypogaea TaxID=3818 RepID=A0A444WUL2_ARAHY|nr:hypothetical protein Ahy_Scaffold1g107134 [Arachis hypogaea]